MNLKVLGQEEVIRAANDLLASYGKGNGRAYLAHLQTLLDSMIPMFPHIATAVAVHPLLVAVLDEWQEKGDVSQAALAQLWEEYYTPHVGRA